VIAALVFRQSPGLIVPDTKLDLTANPGGLLTRALSLWDDDGLGQLQNQAYGYLFPMGPFHWVLHELGAPGWVVQRLWWTFVLSVAFLGFWRLARALGVGRPAMQYAGAFLFALAPRFLAEVAITSVEVWPMAVAPWVLAPLVDRRPRPGRWRIARSALAFGCIGGVNAVATGVALVLPTLWFLTRTPWRTALRTWASWLAACLLAATWWLGPLALLGRYSPPFLDWIENAPVTTGMSSIFNAFQGTAVWLNFLAGPTGPTWPAGWLYVTQPALILATVAVSSIGLTALATRDVPERSWLVISAVAGLALLTMGFAGALASPLAPGVRELLDGVLAALRNTHKFEVVLRLPLILGFVHLTSRPLPMDDAWRTIRRLRPVLVGLLVVAAAAPALAMKLPRPEGYPQIASHWYDAARWLDGRPEAGSVLVVPASSFADFAWGSTKDEPLQALMRRPFAVRDAVPLGSAGSTRLLDELIRRMGNGEGGPELRSTLASMGVRFVVVRNDLRLDAQANEPIAVHEALAESGMSRAAAFGLTSHSTGESATRTVNERTVLPYPSVEVFDVGGEAATTGPWARLVPGRNVVRAVGGPEDVPSLLGVLGTNRAALMGSDSGQVADFSAQLPTVLTDGVRRQEVFFGRAAENTSPTLSASDTGRLGRRTLGYVSDPEAPSTTLTWDGVANVVASSSASDADATLRLGPAFSPSAAVDGDPETRWVSGRFQRAVGEWIQIGFKEPRSVEGTSITVANDSPVAAPAALVRVETDRGATTVLLKNQPGPQPLLTPAGSTQTLRVTLVSTAGPNAGNGFGIAEIGIPGLRAGARLEAPGAGPGVAPATVILRAGDAGRSGCLFVGERPLCASRFVRTPPEVGGLYRAWSSDAPGTYSLSGTVVAAPRPGVDKLLDLPGTTSATASSRAVPGAAGRPSTVADRDLGTGWVASASDPAPRLTLRLPERRVVSSIQFVVDKNLAASSPRSVELRFDGGGRVQTQLDTEGRASFASRKAQTIAIRFLKSTQLTSIEAASGFASPLPVGVSEVLVEGAEDLARRFDPGRTVGVPCGFGPSVTVNGVRLTTEVRGSARDLVRGQPLQWRVCGQQSSVAMKAGRQTVDAPSTAEFVPHRLVLAAAWAERWMDARAVMRRGGDLVVPTRVEASLLVLNHNFNTGWRASTVAGAQLAPVRVNGWQQGYVVPAGAGTTIREEYAPTGTYRLLLLLGLIALAGLAGYAWVRRRGRGRPDPPLPPRAAWRWPVWLLAVGLLVVLSGIWGVAALVVSELLLRTVRRGVPWVVLGTSLAAGGLVALRPWLAGGAAVDSAPAQALVLVAFALVVRRDSWLRPQRMMGRSRA
jgi:arabinofuranan 3-O-arabinosyltransferase